MDVLVRIGDGWQIGLIPEKRLDFLAAEVKSSLSVKPQHIDDVSFQVYVLRKCGVPVVQAGIMILNREYDYRGGGHDLNKLFRFEMIAPKSEQEIETELSKQLIILNAPEPPAVLCGSHCHRPYDCEFLTHCRGPYIPCQPSTHLEGLKTLSQLQYPIRHLDFEAVTSAIPLFAGVKCWQQVPTQFSTHLQREPNGVLEHDEFLHDLPTDPRRAFLEALLSSLGDTGTILMYSSYEETILKRLSLDLPEYAARIEALRPRLFDLYKVVKATFDKDDPAFFGSLSIKNVARALVPEVDYSSLDVHNGDEAVIAKRQAASTRARKSPFDPERTVRAKHDGMPKTIARLKTAGCDARVMGWRDPLPELLEWLSLS